MPFVARDANGDDWVDFRGTDNPGTLWKTRNATIDPDPVTTWINNYAKALFLMGGKNVAIGTDADGLSPLIHQDVIPTEYPFSLNPVCPPAPADCPERLDKYTFGNRTLDFQKDGIANYGMLPDFIQAASQIRPSFMGGSKAPTDQITALLHSAEDTIAMWEAVTAAAAKMQ